MSMISVNSDPLENFSRFFQSLNANCVQDCMHLLQLCIVLMFSPFGLYAIRPNAYVLMVPTMIYFYMQAEAHPSEPMHKENIFKDLPADFDFDAFVDIATNAVTMIQRQFPSPSDRLERLALYQMLRWRWHTAFSHAEVLPGFAEGWDISWKMQLINPPPLPFMEEFSEIFTKISVHMTIYAKRAERMDTSKLHDLFLQVQGDPNFQRFLQEAASDEKELLDDTFRAQTPSFEPLQDMDAKEEYEQGIKRQRQNQEQNKQEQDQLSKRPRQTPPNVMDISAARAYTSRKQKENPSTGCHVM